MVSDVASFTTGSGGVPGIINAPSAPTSLTATASGTSRIDLSWNAPSYNGGQAITGYKIEISSDGGTTWTDHVAGTRSTATTYAHIGLAAGTTRHYRVSARNSEMGLRLRPSPPTSTVPPRPGSRSRRHR